MQGNTFVATFGACTVEILTNVTSTKHWNMHPRCKESSVYIQSLLNIQSCDVLSKSITAILADNFETTGNPVQWRAEMVHQVGGKSTTKPGAHSMPSPAIFSSAVLPDTMSVGSKQC